MNNSSFSFISKNKYVFWAFLIFAVGGVLTLLCLIQKIPLILGVAGVGILTGGLFYFCLRFVTERSYKEYYEDSYNIEHETIEEEIKKSATYHLYQEAVLKRYESACRDLGLNDEQCSLLLMLLIEEKKKVEDDLAENGISI